jgi:uncharacterized RDD family membrane protein YckC
LRPRGKNDLPQRRQDTKDRKVVKRTLGNSTFNIRSSGFCAKLICDFPAFYPDHSMLMKLQNIVVRRAFAYIIDILICFLCILLTQWLFLALKWNPYAGQAVITDRNGLHTWVFLTVTFPVWLYFAVFEKGGRQTFGKRIMHLIVVTGEAKPIPFSRSMARNAIKLIPWEANHLVLFYMGDLGGGPVKGYGYGYAVVIAMTLGYFICMLASRQHRAPHDMLAGTDVVMKERISITGAG